jgi:hypothetical protein
MEDAMPEFGAIDHAGLHQDAGFKELEVVAYLGEFKIVGVAHFGMGGRTTSRRASDFIRAFSDSKLTLSKVRIYSKGTQELLETVPFVLLNMDKVDFIYARDGDDEDAGAGPA